jgi:hypothetical protein
MSHPLSEIITAKLNGDDPHARTTIPNGLAVEIRDELNRLSRYTSVTADGVRVYLGRQVWLPVDVNGIRIARELQVGEDGEALHCKLLDCDDTWDYAEAVVMACLVSDTYASKDAALSAESSYDTKAVTS